MTIWTPDGERPVGEQPAADDTPELTPEQEVQAKEMAKELADTRVRLMETEVSTVLANHCFGIYELAAIHLTAEKPKLAETSLAIDALSALVEGLSGKLGEAEPTLKEGLHQLRMGFVQRNNAAESAQPESQAAESAIDKPNPSEEPEAAAAGADEEE